MADLERDEDEADDSFPPYGEPLPDTAYLAARSATTLADLLEALGREFQEAHSECPEAAEELLRDALVLSRLFWPQARGWSFVQRLCKAQLKLSSPQTIPGAKT